MPFTRCYLTSEVLKHLRESNPEQAVTENRVRSAIRRGAVQTPRILSGCYFWTWDEVRSLAQALNLDEPQSPCGHETGEGGDEPS